MTQEVSRSKTPSAPLCANGLAGARPTLATSFFIWLLRTALFSLTALLLYLILALLGSAPLGIPAALLVVALAVVTLPLALTHVAPKLQLWLERLQVMLAWTAVALVSVYWVQTFPELLFFLLAAALVFLPQKRVPAGLLTMVALALIGVAILVLAYRASWEWPAAYLVGLAVAAAAVHALRLYHSRRFRGVALIFLALQLAAYDLSLLVYTGDQTAEKGDVARQDGVSLALPQGAVVRKEDVIAFLARAGRVLLFSRHRPVVTLIEPSGAQQVFETAGSVANDIVFDVPRKRFYFFSGRCLYAGSLETLAVQEIARITVTSHSVPASLRAQPGDRVSQLLLVYDGNKQVVLYDVDTGRQRSIELPYEIMAGAWHPRGTKLLLYGKGPFFGHLLLVDLAGKILRERTAGLVDRVEFTRIGPEADAPVAMFFLRGRLERFSVDTLETQWAVSTVMPRAVVESSSGECLIVPSYSRGTLSVLRSRDGERLQQLRIGRRVRIVTMTPERDAYWISSAAGQFVVQEAALPRECRLPLVNGDDG
jgi:hypothetical protein